MYSLGYTGRRIGNFVVQERLARGGMAEVYRAIQPTVQREVALKVIALDPTSKDYHEFRGRFEQEARIVAMLEHLHILPIYDYGIVQDELAFIAMRLMRGGSLDDLLGQGPLPSEAAAVLFTQIAGALSYTHSQGVLHRDLKPSNILLDEQRNAYLTDFGLAKWSGASLNLTGSGNVVGTLTYIAPETLHTGPVDHRSDIYSLGCILFHMFTGRPPFVMGEGGIMGLIHRQANEPPPPPRSLNPALPAEVETVILRALDKDYRRRYFSADEMAVELNRALGRKTGTGSYPALDVSSAPMPAILAPRRGRARWGRYLALGAALILLAGGVLFALFDRYLPAERGQPTILLDEEGTAEAVIPTEAELAAARAYLGARGFIAYLSCTLETEFQTGLTLEMTDQATAAGLDFRSFDSSLDAYLQLTQIEQARFEGARIIIICPLNSAVISSYLQNNVDATVNYILTSPIEDGSGVPVVSVDNYAAGRAAGLFAGQQLWERRQTGGRVVILNFPTSLAATQRTEGMKDGLQSIYPDAEINAEVRAGNPQEAEAAVARLLDEGVEFDLLLSFSDGAAYGAVEALEAAGMAPDSLDIVSINGEALARQAIADGRFMRATVSLNRELTAQALIHTAVKLLAGATVPGTVIIPPGDLITIDSAPPAVATTEIE